MNRRQALARGETLPTLAKGSVLFADISGFTLLSETLPDNERTTSLDPSLRQPGEGSFIVLERGVRETNLKKPLFCEMIVA